MESGSELSKTVATFILQKILLDESGLSYICQTYDRFSHVAIILVSNFIFLAPNLTEIIKIDYFCRVKWYYNWQKSHLLDF